MNDYEKYKKRLYHSYKNENWLLPVILFSIFAFFCKGGILNVILIWIGYGVYCVGNNAELDKDPDVLETREIIKQLDEKYRDK